MIYRVEKKSFVLINAVVWIQMIVVDSLSQIDKALQETIMTSKKPALQT